MYKFLKAKAKAKAKEMVMVMVMGKDMVDLGYNPSELFVFCQLSPLSLPRARGWRVGHISGSPALLSLDLFVAGEKVAAFLFVPVHRATFLWCPGFL